MPRGRAEAILPGRIGNIALVARRASALLTTRRNDPGRRDDPTRRPQATQPSQDATLDTNSRAGTGLTNTSTQPAEMHRSRVSGSS